MNGWQDDTHHFTWSTVTLATGDDHQQWQSLHPWIEDHAY
jgi:hypothetical protein